MERNCRHQENNRNGINGSFHRLPPNRIDQKRLKARELILKVELLTQD
jgi:hypothetical protein